MTWRRPRRARSVTAGCEAAGKPRGDRPISGGDRLGAGGEGVELLATLDATATGSLHRCQLALEADAHARGYHARHRHTLIYDQAAEWLQEASKSADPPSLVEHAQQAGRFPALAIGALDRDTPSVPEAIAARLAHLLFACTFADAAAGRTTA
jgi:hypothetical protein